MGRFQSFCTTTIKRTKSERLAPSRIIVSNYHVGAGKMASRENGSDKFLSETSRPLIREAILIHGFPCIMVEIPKIASLVLLEDYVNGGRDAIFARETSNMMLTSIDAGI